MGAFDVGSVEAVRPVPAPDRLDDLTQPESEEVIRDAVTEIVNDYLPGVRLAEMVKNPL